MRLIHLVLLSFGALLVGCSHRGGYVEFDTPQGRMTQSFSQAFVTSSKNGEFDIVLLDSDEPEMPKSPRRGPLPQVPLATVRQAMHIHVNWKPRLGTTRNPAAINSSITWYVLGPDGANAMLTYEGAAYVSVHSGETKRTIVIKDGEMEPRSHSGEMNDPIGSAHIRGEALANISAARVKEALADIENWKKQSQASAGE